MKASGVVENECYMTLTISHDHPPETVGTLLPLFKDQDVDILKFLREKVPHCVPITEVHASIDGRRTRILDNSSFIWACSMHLRSNNRKWVNLPIYINNCPELPNDFTSSNFCGVKGP